jgi:hypothetical protein
LNLIFDLKLDFTKLFDENIDEITGEDEEQYIRDNYNDTSSLDHKKDFWARCLVQIFQGLTTSAQQMSQWKG